MNGTDCFRLIEKIRATSSKNEKIDLIRSGGETWLWKKLLQLAYDPFVTFGLTPPKVETDGRGVIGSDETESTTRRVITLLECLASRKITGNEAREMVKETLMFLDVENADLLFRVLLKDLRAGFTDGSINKAYPGLISTFDVMLAHKFEPERIKVWPVAVEPKLDGVRVAGIAEEGKVTFLSRNGKEFPAIAHLSDAIWNVAAVAWSRAMKENNVNWMKLFGMSNGAIFFDGEVCSGEFNKTVGDVRRKDGKAIDAVYNVFDCLPLTLFRTKDKIALPYKVRRGFTEYVVGAAPAGTPIRLVPRYLVNSVEEIHQLYENVRNTPVNGKPGEGLIVKPLDGIYEKKRSHSWMKIKAEETFDLRIVDAFEGTGKYEGMLGGLVVDVDGVSVSVGGGFSDEQRKELWELYQTGLRDGHDGRLPLKLIGRLIEVEYHEKTPDGSLRHPRFVRFRDDKDKGTN